eukprot:GHVR01039436.1.p1 GENE.GHVR01039436.1~~GHVR01039436.1.p1  ORF type:complete len:159 (+),score=17.04 GHVR01039436.1:255-731(+)
MFRTEKLNVRSRLARLPQILDYDCDSDWEDEEEAEIIDSMEEDSDDIEESSQEWIDSDVENVELTKSNKKPSLTIPSCKFTIFASFPESWLQLPLIERDIFPEEYLEAFKDGIIVTEDITIFSREFGKRYVIKLSAINKKLKELGISKNLMKKKPCFD